MAKKNMKKNIEKRFLQNVINGILKKRVPFEWLKEGSQEVGFTTGQPKIFVAWDHEIMKGLTDDEKKMFRTGVTAHETLHQTEPEALAVMSETAKKLPQMESKIYCTMFNLLEDCHIEYYAPERIGGLFLKGLKFSIHWIYKTSPKIEESPTPFAQFVNALVMFGDKGVVKGSFTSPEAKKCFCETAGIFNEAILYQDATKRSEVALQLMEISRELWEAEAKNEELMKSLMDFLEKEAKERGHEASSTSSSSSKDSESKDKEPEPTKTEEYEKRKSIADKLKKAMEEGRVTFEEDESSSSKSSDEGDKSEESKGDDTTSSSSESGSEKSSFDDLEIGDDDEIVLKKGEKGADDGISISLESSDSDTSDITDDTSSSEDGEGDASDSDSDTSPKDGKMSGGETSSTKPSYDAVDEIMKDCEDEMEEEEDVYLTEDDICEMDEAYDKAEKELAREESESTLDYGKMEEMESDLYLKEAYSKKDYNILVEDESSYEYEFNKFLSMYGGAINAFAKKLERIFKQDIDSKDYKKSGKVNIKRYSSSKVTARVFTKNALAKDIDDINVFILVDESGSMNCTMSNGKKRNVVARETVLGLTEAFSKLKIPTYVMGFSGEQHADIEHYHYVKWNNSKKARLSLFGGVLPRCQNFDAYSLNVAHQMMKKRRSDHKLIIVVSDGVPYCTLRNELTLFKETKEEVRRTRKDKIDVLGIAIGNSDTEMLQNLYGKHFFHTSKVEDVFMGATKQITKIIQSW